MSCPGINDEGPKMPQRSSVRQVAQRGPAPKGDKLVGPRRLIQAGPKANLAALSKPTSPGLDVEEEPTRFSEMDLGRLQLQIEFLEGVDDLKEAVKGLSSLLQRDDIDASQIIEAKIRLSEACTVHSKTQPANYGAFINRLRSISLKLDQELGPEVLAIGPDLALLRCLLRHNIRADPREEPAVKEALAELEDASPPSLPEWLSCHAGEGKLIAAYALLCPAGLEFDEKKERAQLLWKVLSGGGAMQVLRLILEQSVLTPSFLRDLAKNRRENCAELKGIPFLRETTVASLFITLAITEPLKKWSSGLAKSLDIALSRGNWASAKDIAGDKGQSRKFGKKALNQLFNALAYIPIEAKARAQLLVETLVASLGMSRTTASLWVLDTVFLRGVNPECLGLEKCKSQMGHRILATQFLTAFIAEAFSTSLEEEGKKEAMHRVNFCRSYRGSLEANDVLQMFFP